MGMVLNSHRIGTKERHEIMCEKMKTVIEVKDLYFSYTKAPF